MSSATTGGNRNSLWCLNNLQCLIDPPPRNSLKLAMVTAQMWGTLSRHIFVLIFWYSFIFLSEEYIALAVLRLVEEEKATIEGAGSTGLAACLAGLVPELKGKR